MQLYGYVLGQMSLDELREACSWTIRLGCLIGPDEPGAKRELLRLASALVDEYERAVRREFGLPERDFLSEAGEGQ